MTTSDERRLFAASMRRFFDSRITPLIDDWESQGIAYREVFPLLGSRGYFGIGQSAEYGGLGLDETYVDVWATELGRLPAPRWRWRLLCSPTLFCRFSNKALPQSGKNSSAPGSPATPSQRLRLPRPAAAQTSATLLPGRAGLEASTKSAERSVGSRTDLWLTSSSPHAAPEPRALLRICPSS